MDERVSVIVNPAAGRGRGAKMIPDLERTFGSLGVTDIRSTAAKGEETHVANAAVEDGATTLVVVGGDGTTGNVANAILNSGKDIRLAVMPAGTGNDFAKVVGTARATVEQVARAAVESGDMRADVGKIEDVYFLNCCGFGFDVAVLEEIGRNTWLRGNAVYLWTAVQQLFGFHGTELALRSREMSRAKQLHMLLVIANSPHFGGMFRIAPDASVIDGLLDAVAITDVPPLRRMSMLAAAARGTHPEYEECTIERSALFDLTFAEAPAYETDGELHHARSASVTVTCCPRALRVVAL